MKERHTVRIAVFTILERNGLVRMMRRYQTGHMDGKLGLPSGHVEKGEDPIKAVLRETEEETGIVLGPVKLVHTQYNVGEEGEEYMNLYFAPVYGWTGEVCVMEPNQCSEIVLVSLADLVSREMPEIIPYVAFALRVYELYGETGNYSQTGLARV